MRSICILAVCCVWTLIACGAAGELNVVDFGAVGDGVTDDTAALRRAFAYLETHRPKERLTVRRHKKTFGDQPLPSVFFPKGRYRITDSVVVTGNALLVGAPGAQIVNTNPQAESLYFRRCQYLLIKGLAFEGGLCQVRLWTANRDCSYFHIDNCAFSHAAQVAVESVSFRAEGDQRPATPLETACGEVRGVDYNNSTLIILEKSRFTDNLRSVRLYSDGVTIRDCAFVAPAQASAAQLDLGGGGRYGVEMYLADNAIDYPAGALPGVAAIHYRGGRCRLENMAISAQGDLTAIRSTSRFNEYHKPSGLDLRDIRLNTGKAPVISFAGMDHPNRVSVYGLSTASTDRPRLFAFDAEPTAEYIGAAYADMRRQAKNLPAEACLAFYWRGVDEAAFDVTLPPALTPFRLADVPETLPGLSAKSRVSRPGKDEPTRTVIALPADWSTVYHETQVLTGRVCVTSRGRAAITMADETRPTFRVAPGADVLFENLMFIDGLHAIEAEGAKTQVRVFDCTFAGQKGASVVAKGTTDGCPVVSVHAGRAYTPFLYSGNGVVTFDAFWFESGTDHAKGEYNPTYSAIVNGRGGALTLRDFLGVPCYFQHTPKNEAYQFGLHVERRGDFRWVENYGRLVTLNTRWGGEWGGLTPVYQFGPAASTYIEGGNVEIGSVYLKAERAVVVADRSTAEVTVVNTLGGHHIEPFQAVEQGADGKMDVLPSARLAGNYPFANAEPIRPAGEFRATFVADRKKSAVLEVEASSVQDVYLNGQLLGRYKPGESDPNSPTTEQAIFKLLPLKDGVNEIRLVGTTPGEGFLLARVISDGRLLARTMPSAKTPACVKPPRSRKYVVRESGQDSGR
ncbi:MAG: glycoside hydrolase family 55 protein [Kiritimatiellae bacterium]|nr:glycoside hydrolase family 55 protein [Kiritimatiellia bacterium]